MGLMVIGCGRSWPGGLVEGRFNWLHLPASPEAVERFVANMLACDEGEHDAVSGWASRESCLPPEPKGMDAYVVDYQDSMKNLDALHRTAIAAPTSALLAMENVPSAADLTAELHRLGYIEKVQLKRSPSSDVGGR